MEQLAKLNRYREILQRVIEKHAAMKPSNRRIDSIAIADTKTDNYLMMDIGHDEVGRAHDVIIHLRLRDDGKVLIEWDGIEYGVARDLVEAGVAKEDILFNMYREPRPLTELAAA
jgi:hypothetical protein